MFTLASLIAVFLSLIAIKDASCTGRPIIGILAQEMEAGKNDTYVAASYVKAVEASGARAIPVFLKKDVLYYKDLMYKINGLVIPGGAAPWDTKGGFFQTVARLYSVATKMNNAGINFPILGVCQGFEALALVTNNMENQTLEKCNGMDGVMLPLKFKNGYRNSNLYKDASIEIIDTLKSQNVTPNYHLWCLRPNTLKTLKTPWKILSTNYDGDGIEFVSSMEYGNFAGVQFHPEKCAYEWVTYNPSYKEALLAARHFYDWLVTESRKNDNKFKDTKEEDASLFYNYNPVFYGKTGGHFEQVYLFNAQQKY